jgi:hypothetical protein
MNIPLGRDIWRKYSVPGVPASGPHQPNKAEIIAWTDWWESMLNAGAGSAGIAYANRALLFADLAHAANTTAFVYADTTAAYNGLYVKTGGTGSGSWSRIGDLPTSLVPLTVTGGTGDTIVATAPETPSQPGSKLYLLTPTADNTGAATIAVNGGAAAPIKTALGSNTVAGSLIEDSIVLMAWSVDHYRLMISVPVDASGVLNDVLDARDEAEDAASSATASAAALGNQVHQYDTRAQAMAATIPVGVQAIRIYRYATGYPISVATYVPGTSAGPLAFQEGGGNWWELNLNGGKLDALWFGAAPRTSASDFTTDSTAAIQAAMDLATGLTAETDIPVEVHIPASQFGWGITQLVFNAENLHLVGVGGPTNANVALHYLGTGADEEAMIYADYIVHHDSELFHGCAIRNLRIDGENKALHCLKLNGWTRYCNVEHVVLTKAVNPIHCTNGFYSRWADIEVLSPPKGLPSGMSALTHAANAYGAFFDICHIMRLESFKITDVGGALSFIYSAGLRIAASEAVHVDNLTMETGREANDRFKISGVSVGSGSTVTFDSMYVENIDFHDQLFDLSEDNIMVTFQGVNYWNDFETPVCIKANPLTPIAFNGSVFGEGLNQSDRFLKDASGAGRLKGVTLNGNMTLFSGPATGGTYYNAAAVASTNGVVSDSITSLIADAGSATGTIVTGYEPAIVSNYILVTPGRAIINGWPVSNVRHTGLHQRLFPELAYVGAWNVKVNSLGCPFIEKQAAAQPGSAYAKTIATFNTTGGTNNPSNLVEV